ncbi:hypothetical protein LIER_02209 [Lithospermum erythrorhizon]|uniref:Uncharacterized protein n=1 Tax=Lithospermum erythrorhizon TaxID=34254 RepID=A0AAV3NP22_LITER
MSQDQIDPDISRWILEFLLRKPIKDSILIPLASALPIAENNFIIKKLFFLRILEFEVSNCMISEKFLEFLEQIHELDQLLGNKECPDSLKKAYCAVAIECSVRCLRNGYSDVKGEFFDVVKRVWRGRVGVMIEGNNGLVFEELLDWKCDIEDAVWEESVCLKVVERSKDIDVVEVVRAYLREEKARMGPSFLELVVQELKGRESVIRGARKTGEGDQCGRDDGHELKFDNKGKTALGDTGKRNSLPRRKHVARKRSRLVSSGYSRGSKIVNFDDSCAGPSFHDHLPLPGTPEVEKVQDSLESSRLELRAVVKDPLPEALRLAESVTHVMHVAIKDLEPPADKNLELLGGQNRGKSPVDNAENPQSGEANVGVENVDFEPPGDQNRGKDSVNNAVNVQSGEANTGNGICSGQTSVPKSLLERNKTARTFEWDDSIDRLPEDLSDSSSRPYLPSPRAMYVTPLNMYKEQNLQKRRQKKRWSTVEEDTLRAGVQKFGKGYWKLILNTYRDIFEDRTEVDLKDKWRNMTR